MKASALAEELKIEYKKQQKGTLFKKLVQQLVDKIQKGVGVPPATCSEAGAQPTSENDADILLPDENVKPANVDKFVDITMSQFDVNAPDQPESDDNAITLVPDFVVAKFKIFAENNFKAGIESLGYLFGKKVHIAKYKRELWVVECLFLPLQTGTKDTCQVSSSHRAERVVELCEKSKWELVGWIHTHPTYDAFLSSVDQHMHFMWQRDNKDCVAAVVGRDGNTQFFRLSDAGMDFIPKCTGDGPDGFHVHPPDMFERELQ